MAFDTSIFRTQPVQAVSPMNALLQGLQLQGAAQGNALQRVQMESLRDQRQIQLDAARDALEEKRRMRNALQNLPEIGGEAVYTPGAPAMNAAQADAAVGTSGYGQASSQGRMTMGTPDPTLAQLRSLTQQGLYPLADYIKRAMPEQKLQAVGMDQNIVDMNNGGRVVRPGQARHDAGTTDQRDYAAVVAQGYKGTFMDYQREMANLKAPKPPVINVGTGKVGELETNYRKEFNSLPEVTKYKNALPAFKAVEGAASREGPQADINLIYGLAKLYDPDSVVREGEYDTIANSQSIPEWIKGAAQKLTGGGRLTPATKAQILTEARARIGTFENEYKGAQQTYTEIVRRQGLDPRNIFTPVGGYQPPKVDAKPTADTGNIVRTPDGQVFTFPNKAAADAYKKAAGLS